jgi:hypothetical protein
MRALPQLLQYEGVLGAMSPVCAWLEHGVLRGHGEASCGGRGGTRGGSGRLGLQPVVIPRTRIHVLAAASSVISTAGICGSENRTTNLNATSKGSFVWLLCPQMNF